MFGTDPLELLRSSPLNSLPASKGPALGFAGAFSSNYSSGVYANSEMADYAGMTRALNERDTEIERLTGQKFTSPFPYTGFADYMSNNKYPERRGSWDQNQWDKMLQSAKDAEGKIEDLRKQYPQIKSRAEIEQQVRSFAAQSENDSREQNTNLSLLGKIGAWTGIGAAALSYNPKMTATSLITAPLGGIGGSAWQIAKATLTDALLNAGSQAASEFGTEGVQAARARVGLEHGTDQAVQNVLMAGAMGATFHVGLEGVGKAIPVLAKGMDAAAALPAKIGARPSIDKLLSHFRKEVKDPLPIERMAADVLERKLEVMDQPLPPDRSGEALVAAALAKSDPLPQIPLQALPREVADAAAAVARPDLNIVSVRDLNVDAERFQFKGGGDANGVTERLRGVTSWNPDLGGSLIVFKDTDGKLFVADGHQRVGLAKKLIDEKRYGDIQVPVHILDAADGITPEHAMAYAAGKNIAEGTGSAIDAARIMRLAPDDLPELPPQSALVRTARDLARVHDDVFRLALNDKIKAEYAGLIGRLEPNQNFHLALADLLIKTEPETLFQAESIIKQAREAGFNTSTQGNLFGDEAVSSSLFKERSKVLERSLRLLRDDAKTFRTLTDRAETIIGAGNSLNNAGNAAKLSGTEAVLSAVTKLANTKGEISDALSAAARTYADTGKLKHAADAFLTVLRQANDEGSLLGGLSAGDERALTKLESEGPEADAGKTASQVADIAASDAEKLEKSSDDIFAAVKKTEHRNTPTAPVTDQTSAGAQTVLPGAEKASDATLAQRGTDAPLKGGDAPADFGLFDTESRKQLDMFGLPGKTEVMSDGVNGMTVHVAQKVDDVLADVDDHAALSKAMKECLL